MLLPQILQSRTQIALPLLRRSIRIKTHPISSHPRCFTTLYRNEGSATTIPTEELKVAPTTHSQAQEPEATTTTQLGDSEGYAKPVASAPLKVHRVAATGSLKIRRVDTTGSQKTNVSSKSQLQQPRISNVYRIRDYRSIRLQRLLDICRSTLVVPPDVIVVKKLFLNPDDNSIMSNVFNITHADLAAERRWVEFYKDHEDISPIMKKLGTVSVEGDLSRYMVIRSNLSNLNIGITGLGRGDSAATTSVEHFYPQRIDDNMDIIKRGPDASHFILESNLGEMWALDKPDAVELILQQIIYLGTKTNKEFRALCNIISGQQGSTWTGRLYKSVLHSLEKSFVFAKAILDNRLENMVTVSWPYGEESKRIPLYEALETYVHISNISLLKIYEIVQQNLGNKPDKEYALLKSIAGVDKRIKLNLDAIKGFVGMGYVTSQSRDSGGKVRKVDALDVVVRQIGWNIRSMDMVLTSLAPHPRSEKFAQPKKFITKEVNFTSVTPISPISNSYLGASFPPSPTINEIPGNQRGYSTISSPNITRHGKPQALNEFGTRMPSKTLLQRLGRSDRDRPPSRKNAFGNEIINRASAIPMGHKLPPGQGIREKMLMKEEERLKSMQGLGYSLMAADRVGGGTTIQDVTEKDTNGIISMWEGGGDMGGLTDESGLTPLKKGDMCELRLGSGSVLGIYLRPSPHGQPTADFLSWSGEITMLQSARISFAIPSFISEESTSDIINNYDKIYESCGLPASRLSEIILPRSEMTEILDKIRAFSKESRKLYAQEKARFKELYERIALKDEDTELTLFEAAEEIFGTKYGDVELYTTHLALMEDGVRYMADRAVHRATSTFRVRSKDEVEMIKFVTEKIRTSKNQDNLSLKKKGRLSQTPQVDIFQEFVKKSRYLIDISREYQKQDLNSPGGIVKRVELKDVVWDKNDMLFINYIKASILQSGSQAVPMNGLVPVILREMGRYEGELSPVTAYYFCTEIGVWGRWENLALRQKNVSFPGFGTSKVADEDEVFLSKINSPKAVERMGLVDSLEHIRKDWGNMEVFCIDDASAHEIDDGISLERVNENENWVHIHIANPTAWLPPNHWLSDLAFRRKQSLYLPEKVYPMLPPSLTDIIGLGPNRGVMTMSAKINKDGEVLDTNVQAGFVRNVKRYTYDTISEALGHHKIEPLRIQIGNFPESTKTLGKKLTQKQIADLKTLSEIATAYRKSRVKNNMIVVSSPQLDVSIYTGLKSHIHPESRYPTLYRGHPSIKLTVSSVEREKSQSANFLVAELMQLANHITAVFCGTKNIAAPFRAMEYDFERKDIVSSFKNTIIPSRDEFGCVSVERGLKYVMLLGQTRISASPKPHRLMGFDEGYVRATSPLRRYSDMIAHWQIQSYLLGKEPRTHKQISPFVSEMDRGERLGAFTMKESSRFWAAVAVRRMMDLGEPKLPQNMTFMVMDKLPYPSLSTGLVLELGMAGKMKFANKKEELNVGVGDIVGIEPLVAMPGEKFVWFEFKGILRQAEEKNSIFL